MPIYEFRCPECKGEIEVVQSFKVDSPLCPQCAVNMVRLMSSPSMVKIDNIPLKYKSLGITPFKSYEPGLGEA